MPPTNLNIDEWITPKTMLAPGAAGAFVTMATNTIAYAFGAPGAYTAAILSLLLGVATVLIRKMTVPSRVVFALINAIVIFTVAWGTNGVAERATAPVPTAVGAHLDLSDFQLVPSAFAQSHLMPRDGDLLRAGDEIFLAQAGKLRRIPDRKTVEALGLRWSAAKDVSPQSIASLAQEAPFPRLTGSLVRGTAKTIYLLEGGKRRAFPDAATFEAMGYLWKDVTVVSNRDLAAIPLGRPLPKQRRFFRKW